MSIIFSVHCDEDFGRHAGWPDASSGTGPTQDKGSSSGKKITMAVCKADYYDSNNILMVPLAWYMYVQNCIVLDELIATCIFYLNF